MTTLRSHKVKPHLTLQHILNTHLDSLIGEGIFNTYQLRILNALRQCKTPLLGEHWQVCQQCGVFKVQYNSCGNRHCPSCQGANRERWLLERANDLFDVPHHHVTFTVPAQLRGLFKVNKKVLYTILFESMWDTLASFSKDKRSRLQAEIGVISILHTWTQKLEYHPHLHCIVPAGGLTHDGKWKTVKGNFLFSVNALSSVFKAKFCEAVKFAFLQGKLKTDLNEGHFDTFIARLKAKQWVVNSKPGFNGKNAVIEYLGRYTHKIAISNYRFIKLDNGLVTFSYRDRNAGDVKKVMSLPVREFMQRFVQHFLPKGFVKIRHYGILSTRVKKKKLALVRIALKLPVAEPKYKLSLQQVIKITNGIDINLCTHCKEGILVTVKVIQPIRGSPRKFPVNPINQFSWQ